MKITLKRITALVLMLFVLLAGLTHGKYATTQSQSIDLNITAAKKYELIFDAHGGVFGNLGEANQDKTYTVTQYNNPVIKVPTDIPDVERYWSSFKGWTTKPYSWDGVPEPEVIPETIDVTKTPRLYAVWDEELIYNYAIGREAGAQINIETGAITFDLYTMPFTFEKLLIPLTKTTKASTLDPTHRYEVSFEHTGSAIYVDYSFDKTTNGRDVYTVISPNEIEGPTRYPSGDGTKGNCYFGNKNENNHILIDNLTDEQWNRLNDFPNLPNENGKTIGELTGEKDKNGNNIGKFSAGCQFVPTGETMYLFLEFSDVDDYKSSFVSISNVQVKDLGVAPIDNMGTMNSWNNSNGSYSYSHSRATVPMA